jgi:hypothetical protein
MPCNASYARLFLEGFSYARQIDMQPICTSMLAKYYSCKKWVLQAAAMGRGDSTQPPMPLHKASKHWQ